MASKQNQVVFQCSGCQEELDLESKTLPCRHSYCRSCLDRHFKGEANGNGQCPECHEPMTLDQLSLSPFLVKSLRRQQLESTDWKCDLCSGKGIDSAAKHWCQDCQKLYCANCSSWHKTFQPKHNSIDLNGMERGEVIKTMTTDMCSLHQKEKDSYCERCNVCLCDTCYQNHSAEYPFCLSRPLSVREEALKQKSQGPTLAQEMDEFERRIRRVNERARNYTEELNSECDSKCVQLWQDFEEMVKNSRQKTEELCEDMRQMTAEQVKKWRRLLEENEKILKELEIWRVNLRHLLSEAQQDVDVVCGLRSMRSNLSYWHNKSIRPKEKCQLGVTFHNWWLQVKEQLKSEKIGSVSLTVEEIPAQNLVFDKQWNLRASNSDIRSIHVSKEDDHVFLCDYKNESIIEFTEWGELVCECNLFDGTNKFQPLDMCSISPDVFVVCVWEKKLFILERRKIPPFLQIKKFIDTENQFFSLCQIKESIFACDSDFQIDSFTKEGKKIQTIKPGESGGSVRTIVRANPSTGFVFRATSTVVQKTNQDDSSEMFCFNRSGQTIKPGESKGSVRPLICADSSTGNFWGKKLDSSEIFCFNRNGQKLQSLKTEGKISHFCLNEFCHIYLCNQEGIFSFSSKEILYKFETKSEFHPRIFVLKNKIFVSLIIDGKPLIKIFKILD